MIIFVRGLVGIQLFFDTFEYPLDIYYMEGFFEFFCEWYSVRFLSMVFNLVCGCFIYNIYDSALFFQLKLVEQWV